MGPVHVSPSIDARRESSWSHDDYIIEERSRPWGSLVAIVSRKDGQPNYFCLDYLSTLSKHLIRRPWPMANFEDNVDMVRRAKFISVAGVQSAYWQIPVLPLITSRVQRLSPILALTFF